MELRDILFIVILLLALLGYFLWDRGIINPPIEIPKPVMVISGILVVYGWASILYGLPTYDKIGQGIMDVLSLEN